MRTPLHLLVSDIHHAVLGHAPQAEKGVQLIEEAISRLEAAKTFMLAGDKALASAEIDERYKVAS